MEQFKRYRTDLPLRGWTYVGIDDLGEPDANCEMCGTEIRYVHYLTHPKYDGELKVGCICAERLTQDYKNPKLQEKMLKDKKKEKLKLLKRQKKEHDEFIGTKWKCTEKGNICKNFHGNFVVIFNDGKRTGYGVCINHYFGKGKRFETRDEAAEAAYSYLFKNNYDLRN